MKKIVAIFFCTFSCIGNVFPQFTQQLDSLCIICDQSRSDSEKIIALGNLANHYYIFKLNAKGDSVLHEQLLIAEVSNNSDLVLQALFNDAILNLSQTADSTSFVRTLSFIDKGINFARTAGRYDFQALGFVRMSAILRRMGEVDKALLNCVSAMSLLQNVVSDSIKALVYVELGNTYLQRGEAVLACTHYNNAYDLAVKMNSVPLQSVVHHAISEMFKSLNDPDQARAELNKSLRINRLAGDRKGMMTDFFDLARLTGEKYFIQRSIDLADSIDDMKGLLDAKRLMLVYFYVVEKDTSRALNYLNAESDHRQSYLNEGMNRYYLLLANLYFFSDHMKRALVFYRLAGDEHDETLNLSVSKYIFQQIGACEMQLKNYHEAIRYYREALALSIQMKDAGAIVLITGKLSELYETTGNFKSAFYSSRQSVEYSDSLRELAKQNDIARLGVERENKKHMQEQLIRRQKEINTRNIQFMGITIVIVVLFFLMLTIGSYPVSPLTVRLMGFFFFISLFEFITLLIDHFIVGRYIHNQPWKLWLVKIAVIASLVPLQQFLEHRVRRLLISKKLMEARTGFSIRKWWAQLNRKAASPTPFDEDRVVM